MPRVLVVDDESSTRISIREFLLDAHYDVDMAEDALNADILMEEKEYDVILSDIILPRMTGVGLLKIIKNKSPTLR